MPRHRLPVRLLASLLALYQAIAPGYLSVVDARPEARAASAVVVSHIEATGNQHAGYPHDERCLLWQLGRLSAERTVTAIGLDVAGQRRISPSETGTCVSTDPSAAQQARAPPVA